MIDQTAFDRYMHGDCDLFALAGNGITGWPIVLEIDEDGHYQHVLLQCSATTMFDASGTRPRMEEVELTSHHGHPVHYRQVEREWLLANLPARQRTDLDARVEAAGVVLGMMLETVKTGTPEETRT